MTFIVLEGFSGSGKTTVARRLEAAGWKRLSESADLVSSEVLLGERADTFSDYSLFGAAMQCCSTVANRDGTNIVAEGYFVSDLAYALIRYELRKSAAFPDLLKTAKSILANKAMRPDLYILLRADQDIIRLRQEEKSERERTTSRFFARRYYTAVESLHQSLGQRNLERVDTDSDLEATMSTVSALVERLRRV